jgi:CHASE1-domain containing sensor protein
VPNPSDARNMRRYWLALAVLLMVAGSAGTVFGVSVFSRLHARGSNQAFQASAQAIASVLTLSIQRQQDLAISAGALVSDNPDTTQAEFLQWAKTESVFARFPELQSISEVQMVTAAELGAYEAFRAHTCRTSWARCPSWPSGRPCTRAASCPQRWRPGERT